MRSAPTAEKLESYECGEPSVGSSFVQFDLRFYVVALVFIVFDVEVAFFFPWAAVFGSAIHLANPAAVEVTAAAVPSGATAALRLAASERLQSLGVHRPALPVASADAAESARQFQSTAQRLARHGRF